MEIKELDWKDLEIGQRVMAEDGYSMQAREVEVLSKEILEDVCWIEFQVVEPEHNCNTRDVFVFGRSDKALQYASKMKFKELGSRFEYVVSKEQLEKDWGVKS